MTEPGSSVLAYESKLAFRRRTAEGWVPGLPRRKRKYEYSDYGEDGETLSVLLSGIDDIKAPFANRRNNKNFILTAMPVREEADELIDRLGTSLWPGEQGRTPTFIDPTFGFDFSVLEHRESIKKLFFRLVMAKVYRYTENQSRSTDEATQQQPQSAEDESGDASEYHSPPQEITKAAKQRARTTVKRRGPYMTKRKRAMLRASEDLQAPAETEPVEIGAITNATAERSTPLMNDQASLDDQSREVIDLEDGRRETLDPSLDASRTYIGRGGKRRAAAIHHAPTKRPRRVVAVNKSPSDHSRQSSGLEAQPTRSASAQFDHPPDTSPELESQFLGLSEQVSPSEAPFPVISVDEAFGGLLTIPDVSQPEFSNQIASPDSLSLSTRALKTSRGLVFEDHVSPDEHISCQPDSRSMAQRNPIGSHKSQESQSRTTAVSLGLPSSANYVAHIQGKLDQQSTPEPSAMTSTAVSLDRGPAADVDLMISPAIVKRTYSEPPLSKPTKAVFPHEVERLTDNVTHLAKDSLDALLSDTDVRLCFGELEHVIMDLEGCHTLVDLLTKIKLYLEEEVANEQISYIDVAQDCDQEFRVKEKTMKRLRLLPGLGRERTYDKFLYLLTSAPPKGESHSFKMYVHVKGS